MNNQPNILFFFSDQFRYDVLGCAGNRIIKTPNLDKLAASGVYFKKALTPTPLCIPARISMITGQRGSATRYINNFKLPGPAPELPSLMTLLHQAGYRTHGIGKTHFEGRHYGFMKMETQEEVPECILDDDYLMYLRENGIKSRFANGYRDLLYYQPQTMNTPLEHSPNEWVANRSIKFLKDHVKYRKNKPFFLWSSYINPHPPFAACEPYSSMYNPDNMEMPENAERDISTLPYGALVHRARLDGAHKDQERMKRIKALYYGLVSHVDDCIGRTIAELEKLGIADNTIIIFASDHGDMLGDHGLSQKNVSYDPSVRIPLIIKWPGITKPSTINTDLVSLLDILPTFIDGLGLEYPGDISALPGNSLMEVLRDEKKLNREEFFIDYASGKDRWISVYTYKYKYTYWLAEGFEELYDLDKDPGESLNISGSDPELTQGFREKVTEWERIYGFKDSFDGSRLRTYEMPLRPSEDKCRIVGMNHSRWADDLPEEEKINVESFAEAFTKAISKETSLGPEKLSIKDFKQKGGNLEGTPWEPYWRKC